MSIRPNGSAVIFDLGGVLLEWDSQRVVATAPLAAPQRQAIAHHLLGHPDWLEFDRGALDLAELRSRGSRRSGVSERQLDVFFQHVGDFLRPRPDTVALLEELDEAGTALYCLTNMPLHYIDALESDHKFFQRFIDLFASSRVGLIKPDPAIFEHVIDQTQLCPELTWFIDDMPDNVDAAANLGINALQFTTASRCRHDLKRAGLLD